MALLMTINPLEQSQILNGFRTVLSGHSLNSRNILALRFTQLQSDTGRDAVLTSCTESRQHLEFGLSWFEHKPGQHPHLSGSHPVARGELVYHPYNDVWSIHE